MSPRPIIASLAVIPCLLGTALDAGRLEGVAASVEAVAKAYTLTIPATKHEQRYDTGGGHE